MRTGFWEPNRPLRVHQPVGDCRKWFFECRANTSALALALRFRRAAGLLSARSANSVTQPGAPREVRHEFKWDARRGIAMQHQLSNSNASFGLVKSPSTANHASEKIAHFVATEATCSMQFKRARNSLRGKQETWERIWLVETALRAAQRSNPHASSGDGCSDRQLSKQTPSVPPLPAAK